MRFVAPLAFLAVLAPLAYAQDGEVLPGEVPVPSASALGEAPELPAQAAVGCLGALRGIRTALTRSDDELVGLNAGERANVEAAVIAAGKLADAGREEVCLQIAEALSPLVSEEPELAERRALGYAVNGIEWIENLDAFVTVRELEGEELYGQTDVGAPQRTALAETELGEVVGAVERLGQITHLVIQGGGFLGIGSEKRAIPIDRIRWNIEERRLETFVDENSFEARAIVEEEDGVWVITGESEGTVRDVMGMH